MMCIKHESRFGIHWLQLAAVALGPMLLAGAAGCGGLGGGLQILQSPQFQSLQRLLQPPATALDGELIAPGAPTGDGKLLFDAPLPKPITPLVLTALDAQPSHAALGPDGQIYYTEKDTGRVRQFDPNAKAVVPTPLLDLPVNNSGQRGLIGITFSSDGKKVFLTYNRSTTAADTSTEAECLDARLVSYDFAPGAISGTETVLWSTAPRDPNFVSDLDGIGPCVVAPDGFLYLGHGDRNSRLTTLGFEAGNPSGKVLRMNQDGTVPAGNPIAGNSLFAAGFRNPVSFAFDKLTGLFWIAEQSSGVSDELNAGAPGATYGWPLIQGITNTEFETTFGQILFFVYKNPIIDFGRAKFDPRGVVANRGGPYGAEYEGDIFVGQSSTVPSVVHRYHVTTDLIIQHSIVFTFPATGGRVQELVAGPDGRIYVLCANELFVLNPG